MNDMTEAPVEAVVETRSLSDLATDLERARISKAAAVDDYERASRDVTAASIAEREAYKAFNDAVSAMKPKRKSPSPRAPKAEKVKAAPKTKK